MPVGMLQSFVHLLNPSVCPNSCPDDCRDVDDVMRDINDVKERKKTLDENYKQKQSRLQEANNLQVKKPGQHRQFVGSLIECCVEV